MEINVRARDIVWNEDLQDRVERSIEFAVDRQPTMQSPVGSAIVGHCRRLVHLSMSGRLARSPNVRTNSMQGSRRTIASIDRSPYARLPPTFLVANVWRKCSPIYDSCDSPQDVGKWINPTNESVARRIGRNRANASRSGCKTRPESNRAPTLSPSG